MPIWPTPAIYRRSMCTGRLIQVARLMAEFDLVGMYVRKKWRRGRLDLAPVPDLLTCDFSASRPNENLMDVAARHRSPAKCPYSDGIWGDCQATRQDLLSGTRSRLHIGQAVAAHSTKPAMTATVAINAKPNHMDVLLGDVCAFLSAVLLLTSSSCGIVDSFFQLLESHCVGVGAPAALDRPSGGSDRHSTKRANRPTAS